MPSGGFRRINFDDQWLVAPLIANSHALLVVINVIGYGYCI